MKHSAFTKWAVALVATAFIGTGAYAQTDSKTPAPQCPMPPPGGGFFGHPGHMMGKLAELGITEQQKEQIKTVMLTNAPAVKPLIQQFVQERRALTDLVTATPVNEAAIRAQVAKVAAVGADLAVKHAHIAEQIRPILTPEQIQKLRDMRIDVESHIDAMIQHVGENAQ